MAEAESEPSPAEDDYAYSQVLGHTTIKGAQVVSLVAPPVLLALALVRRRPLVDARRFLISNARATWLVGPPLGAALGWARMRNLDDDAIADRAYRLRYNESQKRVDRFFVGGAFAVGAATAAFRPAGLTSIEGFLGGSAVGGAGEFFVPIYSTLYIVVFHWRRCRWGRTYMRGNKRG